MRRASRTRATPLRRVVRALAVFVAALSGGSCLPQGPPTLQRGDPAPAFVAADLRTGEPVSVSDYRGRVLLVNLWATWCHPCREETPYLQRMYERYRRRGLRVLGVSIDLPADRDRVAEFVDEMGVEYDVVLDPAAASAEVFRARGLPTSVLVDRDGVVAFSWIGPIVEDDPTFEEALRATLASS